MTVFVAVLGAAPGVGKSTLCAGLAAALPGRVDHFREEEILTRPAFAAVAVAAEFRDGPVALSTLLSATSSFVAGSDADYVITDALFPYLPSLRAWDYPLPVIADFLASLRTIVDPVVLYLDGDPAVTLARAAAREGSDWLDWFTTKLGVPDPAAHLRAERDLALDLLADWDLHVLPSGPPATLLAAALSAVQSPRPGPRGAARPR